MNQVNTASPTIVNNQTVANNYASVGWLYLDNNGGEWFQYDPAAKWTISIGVNIGKFLGVSLTPPAAQNPVYIVNPPKVSAGTDSLQTVKCWTKGSALVPGTLG